DKAKEAVAAKLKEKEAEIDANAQLSDAEKAAAKNKLKRQRTKLSKPLTQQTTKQAWTKRKQTELPQ
ncbi:DUF1542 domain-containing protein, partial [Streptococcus pseudopneumoniae]|uniref:DUF1542 domain-containing protein n=1 Tax=Streptococcus pseudopneumoniae TaxID=257758 RepID=UPI0015D55E22